ncbi:MAG TPA: helix-hairpin-helix domain-containing protein [Nannocystaceae bacterium]|nr:helix-hairpin-helix domain-containing protein [Nannocystaceae bacterium]
MTSGSRCPPPTVPAVLVALATALWLASIARSSPLQVRVQACGRAVVIDGLLRCDDEAPRTIAELCGGEHPLATREITAGDRIEVRRLCDGEAAALARMTTLDLRRLAVPIAINHASIDELRSLPGIGPVLAQRIVAGRPFADAGDLDRVRGIGPKTIARLRARLLLP